MPISILEHEFYVVWLLINPLATWTRWTKRSMKLKLGRKSTAKWPSIRPLQLQTIEWLFLNSITVLSFNNSINHKRSSHSKSASQPNKKSRSFVYQCSLLVGLQIEAEEQTDTRDQIPPNQILQLLSQSKFQSKAAQHTEPKQSQQRWISSTPIPILANLDIDQCKRIINSLYHFWLKPLFNVLYTSVSCSVPLRRFPPTISVTVGMAPFLQSPKDDYWVICYWS